MRHKGGGHKHHYRIVDFKRNKDGIPAKVERIEYDPNRSAHIALAAATPTASAATSSRRAASRSARSSCRGAEAPIKAGNTLPLRNIPVGTTIHCIEMLPGKGAQIARSAGASVQLLAREGTYAQLRLRSGEIRKVHIDCRATIGEVGNEEHSLRSIGKAGAQALARHPPDGARRRDEPGRPPARRRRRPHRRGPGAGVAVGHADQGLQDAQQQAHADDDRRAPQEVRGKRTWHVQSRRARSSTTTCGEGREGARDQGQEADQDLVAPLDDPARFRRPDDRRAQRQAAHAGLRDREHGRPQARRVRADAHVQGPLGRQEGRARRRRRSKETTMETKAIAARRAPVGPEGPAGRRPDPRQAGRPGAQHPARSARRRPPASSRRCSSRRSPTPSTTTAPTSTS